jgi:DNA polymerase I-like protein with 3'-5' exonuclease and polymerase domains
MADSCALASGSGVRMTKPEYDLMTLKIEKAAGDLSDCAPVIRSRAKDFNLASRQQVGEYLQDFGWKPTEFTVHGRPIVNEKTLAEVKGIPEADLINSYLMYQKRVSQITSWGEAVEEDGRVHGFVIPNGAITGRMTHRQPNMAQVPSSSSPFGSDCRALWVVPKGKKLVGVDASGLELRMLAHYMDDEEYTNEIINGDIHTANQKLAGLESRNQAKTFIYALLYGAGDEKLGSVAGGGRSVGSRLRQSFFDNLPAFAALKNRVARASEEGYIKGVDGRKLTVRSQHAALNTLLQSAGAIVMKKALIILNEKIKDLDADFVANVHDEWQIEVDESVADEVGRLGVEAIIEAGLHFDLKCPLDGEYNVGDNWAETH